MTIRKICKQGKGKNKMSKLATVLAACLLLVLAHAAYADGKYFRPIALDNDNPDMPSQRALLVWREGVETLVVESAVDSQSPALAWIMPLPAAPTKIEQISPGLFPTLENASAPVVKDEPLERSTLLGFFISWAVIAVASIIVWFPRPTFLKLVIGLALCGLALGLMLVCSRSTLFPAPAPLEPKEAPASMISPAKAVANAPRSSVKFR